MTTTLEFPFTHPGLNGPEGLMRAHFRTKKEWKDKIAVIALSQSLYRHPGKVRLTYIRKSTGTLDEDNLSASRKLFMDSLVGIGIIADDTKAVIVEKVEIQEKSKRKDQGTVIIIEDI